MYYCSHKCGELKKLNYNSLMTVVYNAQLHFLKYLKSLILPLLGPFKIV